MSKRENKYQKQLIDTLNEMFPGCIILKNDPNYIQGIPDLTVFYGKRWAFLETKRADDAQKQANQDYYIDKASKMSYGAFIYPENEEEVLDELQRAFKV